MLLLPSLQPSGQLASARRDNAPVAAAATVVPLPYSLPPRVYASSDVPWSIGSELWGEGVDRHGKRPRDVYGEGGEGVTLYGQGAKHLARRYAAARAATA